MGLGRWLLTIGAGLLGLGGGAGCRPGPSFVVPDSEHAEATFTPDGARLLARARSTGNLFLYDLGARNVVWKIPGGERAGVSFSPRGEHVVLVTQRNNDPTAALSVVRVADGKVSPPRALPRLPSTEDTRYSMSASALTAVTDDGQTVFSAYGDGVLEIWQQGSPPVVTPKKQGYYKRIALDPRGSRLAAFHIGLDGGAVYVLDKGPSGWTESAKIDGVIWFRWIDPSPSSPPKLGLVTARGIEIWSGGAKTLAVPLPKDAYEVSGAEIPAVFFAASGSHVAVSTPKSFDLFALPGGAKVFSHVEAGVQDAHPGLLLGAEMTSARLRAFLSTGEYLDVDLGKKAVVQRISFGALGHYDKNWYQDGSSWVSSYRPVLGPGGRFIDLNEGADGHKIYVLP